MNNLNQFKPGEGEEIVEKRKPASPRTKSREVALQALYQWHINQTDMSEITKQFLLEGRLGSIDTGFYEEIVTYVSNHAQKLDEILAPLLDRHVSMIDPVEKTIMRIGVFELKEKPEIPYKSTLNEAIELAKQFGSEDGHKFINGILDKVAQDLRADEIAGRDKN